MVLPDSDEPSALLTISDVTVRKRSEEQVQELNRQLSGKVEQVTEVNRELEAFSYSVSHDLRAPLRHIAGFSDKLRARIDENGDETMRHYCDVIADSARRMSTLIEDLLSYSRLGRHALRLQAVDVQSLVEEVRANLASVVEQRAITWRVAPLPVVIADSSMLRLVWQNLIENAIKYTAGKPEALIEIGVDDDAAALERVFWIRDNGAGFDMKYVNKLFGVFQRLHKTSAFSGTGIGLASVRRIIARHGGRTWAQGVPEGGATFFFSLPRHAPVS
jgi:light-regulated signal transduction histidine kinase (bacteriophytochrome)